jgi:hypothetical protein
VLTNRRSRAPCKTDALIIEAFELTGRCIGAGSSVAEGAILMGMTAKAWDESGMKRWDRTRLAGKRGERLAGLAERETREGRPRGGDQGAQLG